MREERERKKIAAISVRIGEETGKPWFFCIGHYSARFVGRARLFAGTVSLSHVSSLSSSSGVTPPLPRVTASLQEGLAQRGDGYYVITWW